jgi:hypothetical protein
MHNIPNDNDMKFGSRAVFLIQSICNIHKYSMDCMAIIPLRFANIILHHRMEFSTHSLTLLSVIDSDIP